jgi:hypothetical protein
VKKPKTSWHNREWSEKMKEIGLYPTDTGLPGGKDAGRHMTHYIVEGGAYERAYAKIQRSGLKLTWESGLGYAREKSKAKAASTASKTKFICSTCEAAIWGKPSTRTLYAICHEAGLPSAMVREDLLEAASKGKEAA